MFAAKKYLDVDSLQSCLPWPVTSSVC